MQQQIEVATPENGNKSRAIIPLADPAPSAPTGITNGPVGVILNDDIVKEELNKLGEMLSNFVKLESEIRVKIHYFLDIGIFEYTGVKPMKLLGDIATDDVTERHVRRYVKATLTEHELGLPPNSLLLVYGMTAINHCN